MKIGVISDTHLTGFDERLEFIVKRFFVDVDLILHAGDLVHEDVLDAFRGKDIKAVCGNMDPLSLRRIFPDELVLNIDGFDIGLIHGWGSPDGLELKLLKRIGKVDCLIYGHTHRPANMARDGVLFFNPGSATDRRFYPANTVGILEINNKTITGKIIELSSFTKD